MYEGKVIAITGGAQGIGLCIAKAFEREGALVCIIDIEANNYFVGDIAEPENIELFVQKIIQQYGKIDCLIHNAKPLMKGVSNCNYEEFLYAQKVGVIAPFYLSKLCIPYMDSNSSIIMISSSRDRMSQAETESYTAAKGGISALTHSLAVSLAGRIRVNSISPGWIDTCNETHGEADSKQHPAGRVGTPQDIAEIILFLCSDKAGFITGENICIDGGMSKKMIYHGDENWQLNLN